MWKYLNSVQEPFDGEIDQVLDNIPDMILKRDEMELEVWCKNENDKIGFVGVTRPVLW